MTIKLHATGALRCINNIWQVIQDSAHEPYNINSVTTGTDRITIYYPPMPAVVGNWVSADETLTRYKILAGASVGLDKTVVQFSKANSSLESFIDPATLDYPYSNIWFGIYCPDRCTTCLT